MFTAQDICRLKGMDAEDALYEAARIALKRAIAVIPGGSICDPQQVADSISALASQLKGER